MYMSHSLFEEEISFDLELNKDVMDTILERYKSVYVMNKMYNTPEYNNMMSNVNSNIQKEFQGLEKVKNTLLHRISKQQEQIRDKSNIIQKLDGDYKSLVNTERNSDDISNASAPRYNDTKTSYTFLIIYVCIQVVAICAIIFIFYKTYKSANAQSPVKKLVGKAESGIKGNNNVNQPAIKQLGVNKAPVGL